MHWFGCHHHHKQSTALAADRGGGMHTCVQKWTGIIHSTIKYSDLANDNNTDADDDLACFYSCSHACFYIPNESLYNWTFSSIMNTYKRKKYNSSHGNGKAHSTGMLNWSAERWLRWEENAHYYFFWPSWLWLLLCKSKGTATRLKE